MQKLSLVFILVCTLCSAQVQRFTYEYKFIPDSTNRSEVIKEVMLLDIDKNGSTYYSWDKFQQDSIRTAEFEKQIKSGSTNLNIKQTTNRGVVGYKVTKQYPDFKTHLLTSLIQDSYKILEEQKPEWKIYPDKQKVGNYDGQKATTSFGGREWTAWFSTDLPFQDGPYKFYGLPGLIVKITDKSGDFDMTLMGNKTINKTNTDSEKGSENNGNFKAFGLQEKEIEVSEKQYKKVWKDYLSDPTKNMRQMMGSRMGADGATVNTVIKMKDANGKEIDQSQMFKQMEKRIKDKEAKNNNRIEPDLYK